MKAKVAVTVMRMYNIFVLYYSRRAGPRCVTEAATFLGDFLPHASRGETQIIEVNKLESPVTITIVRAIKLSHCGFIANEFMFRLHASNRLEPWRTVSTRYGKKVKTLKLAGT